jgi:hypothetical protein
LGTGDWKVALTGRLESLPYAGGNRANFGVRVSYRGDEFGLRLVDFGLFTPLRHQRQKENCRDIVLVYGRK